MRLTVRTLGESVSTVCAQDPALRRLVRWYGPPPLWSRPARYATLAKIILEQQVSLASAATLYRRLATDIPGGFEPRAVITIGIDGLRSRGVTRQKATYLMALGEAIDNGVLNLATLNKLPDADVMAELTKVHGVGRWTASIYLLLVLRRPDVWPPGDLALHKALQRLYALERTPTSDQATQLAEQWSPYRAVAARILWHAYLEQAKESRAA